MNFQFFFVGNRGNFTGQMKLGATFLYFREVFLHNFLSCRRWLKCEVVVPTMLKWMMVFEDYDKDELWLPVAVILLCGNFFTATDYKYHDSKPAILPTRLAAAYRRRR